MRAGPDPQMPQLGAVVLAAGYSRRMGAFKPLLPFGSGTILEQTIDNLRQAGIEHPVVVTGHRSEEITLLLARKGLDTVFNPDFEDGMFSSLQAGIKMLTPETRAFFVQPGDMPLIRPDTLRSLAESFKRQPAIVSYPVFNGRRGHPPLLAVELTESLSTWKGQGGLRAFLQPYRDRAGETAVNDEGILLDLDNQDDYLRAMIAIKTYKEKKHGF
ncbi:MAG: nucleotidyltransferase family protein [Planctomycetaceae bacterium]|nr:MAG: nucleotidyltransferase family protein [Planctomycetaceae bacterium]